MGNYFANDALMTPPHKRAAYSDRTSYLMAEMSRLAYFKFEGGHNLDEIITQVRELIPEGEERTSLEEMLKARIANSSSEQGRAVLSNILGQKQFELIDTFCDPGTDAQAFLCLHKERHMAVLAFRGTEFKFKDIKADINARLVTAEHNGKTELMHSGYFSQFKSISRDIEQALAREEVKDTQLFITGHSLGGALAITAVKFLASDITGACYTFGSPPVGTKTFHLDIKTPIYRIVNYIDIVPRLPNPTLVHIIDLIVKGVSGVAGILRFAQFISPIKDSAWYKKCTRILHDSMKYRQSGYGSYLVGEGKQVQLRYTVGVYDRFMWWCKSLLKWKFSEPLSDHKIDVYSRKLAAWGTQRTV